MLKVERLKVEKGSDWRLVGLGLVWGAHPVRLRRHMGGRTMARIVPKAGGAA